MKNKVKVIQRTINRIILMNNFVILVAKKTPKHYELMSQGTLFKFFVQNK